jgi:hypothetical protein
LILSINLETLKPIIAAIAVFVLVNPRGGHKQSTTAASSLDINRKKRHSVTQQEELPATSKANAHRGNHIL